MLTTELIERILSTIPQRTIGVLGDLFLDRYLDIDPALRRAVGRDRQTAYQVVRVRSYPGAAGTVINNLAALGVGRIYPIAFIGDDGEGYELRQALQAAARGGSRAASSPSPTAARRLTRSRCTAREELNRLDIKNREPTADAVQSASSSCSTRPGRRLDALLVLDQVSEEDCGVVTKRVRDHLAELGERDRRSSCWPTAASGFGSSGTSA